MSSGVRVPSGDDTVVMQGFVLRGIWGLPRALAAGRAQKHGFNAIRSGLPRHPSSLASYLIGLFKCAFLENNEALKMPHSL